jgi:hypothetical protein
VPGEWIFTGITHQFILFRKLRRSWPHKKFQLLILLTLTQADYLVFPILKRELACLTMSLGKVKKKGEGVIRILTEDAFTRVFQMCLHGWQCWANFSSLHLKLAATTFFDWI